MLQLKKFRQKYDQFIVEGVKSVHEFLNSPLICSGVYANQQVLDSLVSEVETEKCFETNSKQLGQISTFKTSQDVLAVFEKPKLGTIDGAANLILALDELRDPGNLGTIIRTAEWFGLKEVVCSLNTADCYNPKVIQASMGSLSRMKIHYVDLEKFIKNNQEHEVVLADMDGKNYKEFKWNKNILVIGNEANGISSYLLDLKAERITIPRKGRAESLNAAISASIILASAM